MTAGEVKGRLLEVYEGREEFSVAFSRLPSNTNGRYLLLTRSIIVDNRKFAGKENAMLYTALHELAHHYCAADLGKAGRRSHDRVFWAVFHHLLDRAEERDIYSRERPRTVAALAAAAREADRRIAALQRELGRILVDLHGLCEEEGVRIDDVVEHDVGLSRATWAAMARAAGLPAEASGLGQDAQLRAGRRRGAGGLRDLLRAVAEGRTVAQLDAGGPPPRAPDPLGRLEAEERRIRRTISALEARLFAVAAEIRDLEAARGGEGAAWAG